MPPSLLVLSAFGKDGGLRRGHHSSGRSGCRAAYLLICPHDRVRAKDGPKRSDEKKDMWNAPIPEN